MSRSIALAVMLCLSAASASAHTVCEGELVRADGGFSVDACLLRGAIARRVLKVCSAGHQCRVTGMLEHCRGIRGACGEIVRLKDARWGTPLPKCSASSAADRANEWWQVGSSIIVTGTIAERQPAKDGGAPYGHTKIVMDLTQCSDGSALPIDRVPDKWVGHYVEVHGSASKSADGGWYIIARDVRSASQ